ncbi:MAG: hypothetical protein KQH83_07750 [Actinobacteria bacterium]|nr:hypothetical protein [Actinomycetota bacterium]
MVRRAAAVGASVALGAAIGAGLRLLYPQVNPGLHGFAHDLGVTDATIAVAAVWMIAALVLSAAVRAAAGWLVRRSRRTAPAAAAAVLLVALLAGPAVLAQGAGTTVVEYVVYVLSADEYDAWAGSGYEGEPPTLTFPEQFVAAEVTFPDGAVRGTGTLTHISGAFVGAPPWSIELTGSFLGLEDGEIGGKISGEYDFSDDYWIQYGFADVDACWETVEEVREECPGCADALAETCAADSEAFHALWDPVDSAPPPGTITGGFQGTLAGDGWADASFTITRPGHTDGPFEVSEITETGYLVFVPLDPDALAAVLPGAGATEGTIAEETTTTAPAAAPDDEGLEPVPGSSEGMLPGEDPAFPAGAAGVDDCGTWTCDDPPVGFEGGLYASAVLGGLLAHLAAAPRTFRHDPDLHADTHVTGAQVRGSGAITTDEYLRPETTPSGRIGRWGSIDEYLAAAGPPEPGAAPGGVDLTDEWHGASTAPGTPAAEPPPPPGFESAVDDPPDRPGPRISEDERIAHERLVASLEDPEGVAGDVREDQEWLLRMEIREALERRGIDVSELSPEERRAYGIDPPEDP